MDKPGLTVADMKVLQGLSRVSINGTPMELFGIEETLKRIEMLLVKLVEKDE